MKPDFFEERVRLTGQLIEGLRDHQPELEALFARYDDHYYYMDRIYRFYHHSFKVFSLQDETIEIVEALRSVLPERKLNADFLTILEAGTGKTFCREDNRRWLEVTRPIVEAFFHARFFLQMAVKYALEFESPPQTMPSGWAALLYLYNLR